MPWVVGAKMLLVFLDSASLPMETCIIDGEATVVDQNGLLVFDLLCYRQHDHAATLWTFDLLELDGADLRLSDLHRPMTPGLSSMGEGRIGPRAPLDPNRRQCFA